MFFGIAGLLLVESCEYRSLPVPGTDCKLTAISYSKQVQPIILRRCAIPQCHSAVNPVSNPLSNYQEVKNNEADVRDYVLLKRMPLGAPLTDCELNTIVEWVNQGSLNN
jgi:hypothetical protein